MVSRFFRYGWASMVAMAMFATTSAESALGHFPFRRHCFARAYCAPAPVWRVGWCGPRFACSSGIWGCGFQRNFYALDVGCWPSYTFSSFPVYGCAPVVYQPVIYTPVIYAPVCASNVVQVSGYTTASARIPSSSLNSYRNSIGSTVTRHVSVDTRPSNRTDAGQIRTLQPYSPVWADSAVGLMDDMVARGDWEVAYRASQRMNTIPSAMNPRLLLRKALLELVAHRDSLAPIELDRVMDQFSQAAEAGYDFSSSELRGGTLARYFDGSGIDLTTILDDLSRRALEQPTTSGRELLMLSVLLTLDGQSDRAALFTRETKSLAALSDSFRWQSVVRSLDGQLEQNSLLAAQDRGR